MAKVLIRPEEKLKSSGDQLPLYKTRRHRKALRVGKINLYTMKTNKILVGGVVGGVVLFLVSWVVWGILLKDYMIANYNQCFMNKDIIWWALIVSNIAVGLLFSTAFSWAKTNGIVDGAKGAAIMGFLLTVFIDLQFYSMSSMFSGLGVVVLDFVLSTIVFAIGGAAVAWGMGLVKNE